LSADAERPLRFRREALAAGSLNHPNVLTVHNIGSHDGAPYLVCELLEGETLRGKLSGRALPPARAIAIARQVATGLVVAHQKGIVHRDHCRGGIGGSRPSCCMDERSVRRPSEASPPASPAGFRAT